MRRIATSSESARTSAAIFTPPGNPECDARTQSLRSTREPPASQPGVFFFSGFFEIFSSWFCFLLGERFQLGKRFWLGEPHQAASPSERAYGAAPYVRMGWIDLRSMESLLSYTFSAAAGTLRVLISPVSSLVVTGHMIFRD